MASCFSLISLKAKSKTWILTIKDCSVNSRVQAPSVNSREHGSLSDFSLALLVQLRIKIKISFNPQFLTPNSSFLIQ